MKTKAVRLYGERDLRLEEFELPPIAEDEILMKIVSDSLCMSSYKAALQGSRHKRVPDNIDREPVIIGHEFCGELVEIGKKWQGSFSVGQKATVQPAIPDNNYKSPGYSYRFLGGDATYVILPDKLMQEGCLLPYSGDAFFCGSLSEPLSCIIGAYHASYHTQAFVYQHKWASLRAESLRS